MIKVIVLEYMFVEFDFSDLELMVPTLLKTKDPWHLWFHKEPLTSMESLDKMFL